MARTRDEDAVLAASEAAIALIVERRSLKLTVAELAGAAGVAERTFYRWFGTKEQVLRPVLDWGTEVFASRLQDPSGSLHDAFTEAFDDVLWGSRETRTRVLFPLVFADPSATAIFFFAVYDGEHRILAPLAHRLELPADSPRVRAVAGAAVTALRVALEGMVADGRDPRPLYAEMLEASGMPANGAAARD